MFSDLFVIISPVLLCAAVGYAWGRLKQPFDSKMVSAIVTTVGTPCLVVSSLTKLEVSTEAVLTMGGGAAAALAVFALTGLVGLRILRLSPRDFLPAVTFPNAGNMGMPLCLFAFGQPGLTLAIAYFSISAVTQLTLGSMIASGQSPLRHIVTAPIVYAVLAALALILTGTQPPEWIARTIDLLAGLTIPLMLIALGVSLSQIKVKDLKLALGFSVWRLGMGLAVGLGLAWVFGFTGPVRGVFILQCAMPVAVFNYLFAARYDRAHEAVAAMVMVSTLISFATLPGLLLLVL